MNRPLRLPHGRSRVLAIVVLLLVVAGFGAYFARDRIEDAAVPPAPAGTPLPSAAVLTPAETAFYDAVGSRLLALIGEAAKLQALGETRSRNVVELQVRASRVADISGQIDGILAAGSVPPRFQPAVARYQSGIVVVRAGVARTKAAFAKFDWDGVSNGLAVFEAGTTQVADAYRQMTVAAGLATPTAGAFDPATSTATAG